MFTIETILSTKLLAKKQQSKVINSEIIIDEDKNKIYFTIEILMDKSLKDSIPKTKIYKQDITQYVLQHGSIEKFFKALVVGEMIVAGYLLIPIDGGYICTGGEEVYSIKDNTCTCPAFLQSSNKPCKHLLYKEGLLEQRARINNWKLNNLN